MSRIAPRLKLEKSITGLYKIRTIEIYILLGNSRLLLSGSSIPDEEFDSYGQYAGNEKHKDGCLPVFAATHWQDRAPRLLPAFS
jgi:hypothetical protein